MKKKTKVIITIIFITYLIFLLYLTLFKNYLGRTIGNYEINLIPLRNIIKIITKYFSNEVSTRFLLRNIFGNIIAFIPFSIFIKLLFNLKNKHIYIITLIFIICIETLQLILKIGFFDIDDIILNMLGVIIALTLIKIPRIYN